MRIALLLAAESEGLKGREERKASSSIRGSMTSWGETEEYES